MNVDLQNILIEKKRLGKEKKYLNLLLDRDAVEAIKDFVARVNVLFPGSSGVRVSTLVENLIYDFLDKHEKDIEEITLKTSRNIDPHKDKI